MNHSPALTDVRDNSVSNARWLAWNDKTDDALIRIVPFHRIKRKKKSFPCRESNPGLLGESQLS